MWTVVATLLPIVAAAVWFFGISALLVVGAACGRAGHRAADRPRRRAARRLRRHHRPAARPDPAPGFPLWMAFLGGAFAIGFGKVIFGGLGQNVFNPALVGRAFLQAAFPGGDHHLAGRRRRDCWRCAATTSRCR
jgi:Na+-translocating ferredoxin:NAD+ oxidoreductase subunit D